MTAKDLMVGDWALDTYTNKPMRIEGINGWNPRFGQDLEPIPLTPEILEKNGFKDGQFFAELLYREWQIMCDCSHIAMRHEGGWLMDIPCKYVHELQHCLKLVGIDKEIVL